MRLVKQNKMPKSRSLSKKHEIIALRVKLVFGLYASHPYTFDFEISESASLRDLHEEIQKAVDFDNDHLFEFYAGRNPRNKKVVYGQDEEFLDIDLDSYNEIFLDEVYPLPEKCKLFYLFDFGDDWLFEISKQRKKPIYEAKKNYPRVVTSKGIKPIQYPNVDEDD